MNRKRLSVITIVYFVLFFMLSSCRSHTSNLTPTFASKTPQGKITNTQLIASSTPTITYKHVSSESTPTRYPTYTPTSTSLPSTPTPTLVFPFILFTPETPSVSQQDYRLTNWTPDKADDLISLLANYPDLAEYYQTYQYYDNYQPAALTAGEALLRFPDDPRAEKWHFEQAKYSAYGIYHSGGDFYRKLIVNALNSGAVKPNNTDISWWFYTYPTDLKISIDDLIPLPGYKSSRMISIWEGGIGGETFWLLEDNDGFLSYPIFERLNEPFSIDYTYSYGDFTGDGIDNILIFLGSLNGTFAGGELVVYDLSTVPPTKLSFGPDPAWSVSAGWAVNAEQLVNQKGLPQIVVTDDSIDSSCWFNFVNTFKWNGQWFDLSAVSISYWGDMQYSCIYTFETYNYLSSIEQQALLDFYESKFRDVTPTGDQYTDYPPDAQDEFRYRLALAHAMLGQQDQATEYLDKIINSPSTPESQWIKPAIDFKNLYQTHTDIYKVCRQAKVECNQQQAIEQLAGFIPNADYPSGIEKLKEYGVPIINSGSINLENDSINENWFITRNQNNELEFWLLTQSGKNLKALPVTTVSGIVPQIKIYSTWSQWSGGIYSLYDSIKGSTYFSVGTSDLFTFIRRQSDQEPFTSRLTSDSFFVNAPQQLDQVISDLLSGSDPVEIISRLVELKDNLEYESKSKFYYYLGLAYELSGKNEEAVKAYIQSWQNCCTEIFHPSGEIIEDPFATMARAKLESNK